MTEPNAASREARAREILIECIKTDDARGEDWWDVRASVALRAMLALADEAASQPREVPPGFTIEGSIYTGFDACLVRGGKTVAHVVTYADALAMAAALADEAASQPREAIAKALYEHRGHASDGAWASDWATHGENGPSMQEIFLREADRLLAIHDTAPTDQAQGGEVERLMQMFVSRMRIACDGTNAGKGHVKVQTTDWHGLMSIAHDARAALAQSLPTDGETQ